MSKQHLFTKRDMGREETTDQKRRRRRRNRWERPRKRYNYGKRECVGQVCSG